MANENETVVTPVVETPKAEAPVTEESKAKVETPVEPPKPKAKPKDIAAIARKESQLLKEKAALDEAKKAVEAEKARLANLKTKPLDLLNELGVSYNDISQAVLSNQQAVAHPDYAALKAEVENLKALEAQKTELAKAQLAQEQEKVVADYVDSCKSLATKEPDKYELVVAKGVFDEIPDLITEVYNKSGKVLSENEALDMLEASLVEELEATIAKSKKLQSKFSSQKQSLDKAEAETAKNDEGNTWEKQKAKLKVGAKTVSNDLAPSNAVDTTKMRPEEYMRHLQKKYLGK